MGVADIVLIVILVVLVVALFVVSYVRKRKFNNDLGQMRADLKVGDKVMTDTGVVGEVVDSYTEENYKYFVLKTGRGNNVGYFTVHANAIYYVFNKENEEKPQKENFNAKPKESSEKVEKPEQATDEKSEKVETASGEQKKETKKKSTKKK